MFQTLSTNERKFLLTAIEAGVRADARTSLETRLLRSAHLASLDDSAVDSLRFGQENGQVIVKLGQTKVLT
jgi:exosome complex RNA-binding protein Rrp42 (RNase PH superfamily)